jgi:hypothetical protein
MYNDYEWDKEGKGWDISTQCILITVLLKGWDLLQPCHVMANLHVHQVYEKVARARAIVMMSHDGALLVFMAV